MMYIFLVLAHKYICSYFPVIRFQSFLFSIKYLCNWHQHFLSHFVQHAQAFIALYKYHLKWEYKIKPFLLMWKFKNCFYNLFSHFFSTRLYLHLVSLQLKYKVNFSPRDSIFRRNVCFQPLYSLFNIFHIKSLLDESSILLSGYWNLWTCLSFFILLLTIMIACFKSLIL